MKELKLKIKLLAKQIGYVACGITSAKAFAEYELIIRERIKRFPFSERLYKNLICRCNPAISAPWVKSIVVCVRWYGKYKIPEGLVGYIGRNYLCDSRVLACPDHQMPRKMKEALVSLGIRVKRGGVVERLAAAHAGVCKIGKNCFAYTQEYGSWINIESFRIDVDLEPDIATLDSPCPQGCFRCIDACPTKALCEPFVVQADRCIAYLSYAAEEPLDPLLFEKMGTWVYGCDVCQQVCPLNKNKWIPLENMPWIEQIASELNVRSLAKIDRVTYEKKIYPLFWYIPPDNISRWRRNAQRAIMAIKPEER